MRVCYKKSPLTNTRSHATPRRPRAPQSVFIGRGQPLGCIPGLGRPWGRLRGSLATSSTPPRSAGRPVVPRGPCRPVSEIRENIENSQILTFFQKCSYSVPEHFGDAYQAGTGRARSPRTPRRPSEAFATGRAGTGGPAKSRKS